VKVLFFMRSTIYVRNFESTLRLLAERGHQVHVVAEAYDGPRADGPLDRLRAEHAGISYSALDDRPPDAWAQLGLQLRRSQDALRYRGAEYADAPKLRYRAELKTPALASTRAWVWASATDRRRRGFMRLLHWCDMAVPRDRSATAFIRSEAPDLVLVTPLVEPGSPQSDYLRAARSLGIPTGLCVYSWDNLTNKGLIHDPLDLVTVWNPAMKREAVELHGVPEHRVVVTGAAAYDHWFTWRPHATRTELCSRAGLKPDRPYLLYTCSSRFIAPNEVPFVRRWIESIRRRSDTLREVGVLVRPHPQNAGAWRGAGLEEIENVAVWPREGANPVDDGPRRDYFDSIHHAAAVVGVNTSAQVESAIVGRGVYTWLAPDFRDTQEGTLHFKHLRDAGGGVVEAASDLAEHVAHLERAVQAPEAAAERCRRFVESFIRPFGLAEPAAPRMVDALEQAVARASHRADSGPWWRVPARPVLRFLARAFAHAEAARSQDDVGAASPPDAPLGTRSKPAKYAGETADVEARAYANYLQAREAARALVPLRPAADTLTATERERLDALQPVWDADQAVIARLREFAGKRITGARLSNYRASGPAPFRESLEGDVERLLKRGEPSLWVNEPLTLGGFGFDDGTRVFNNDTLRWFRLISLLQDAEILRDFTAAAPRRTVWEIGGGWGGFAYHFKTLFPGVTYLITGPAETLLMSAVYLTTHLPGTRMRFYDPACPERFWRDWEHVDVALAPEGALGELHPPALELVVDAGALTEMTPARVERHVARAHASGARYLLTMAPPLEEHPDAARVDEIAAPFYWPHPLAVPAYLDWRLAAHKRPHWLGWRRLHT
jgi:hypothetical protein